MDCKTARLLLDFAQARPPELDAGDREALDSHLADCVDCGLLFRTEAEAEDRLRAAMAHVSTPEGLRARSLLRLRYAARRL